LLQTEDYARHVIASYSDMIEPLPPNRIDELVTIRLARQEILDRKGPIQITAVLDEAVVLRPTGGREVMLGQLTRLVELARRTNVTIRVLPHDGPHPMLAAPFSIIHANSPGERAVVSTEHLSGVRLAADQDEVALHERVFHKIADSSLDVTNSAAFLRAMRALRWR
jgi:Domain of unknown function (DUF5753)